MPGGLGSTGCRNRWYNTSLRMVTERFLEMIRPLCATVQATDRQPPRVTAGVARFGEQPERVSVGTCRSAGMMLLARTDLVRYLDTQHRGC